MSQQPSSSEERPSAEPAPKIQDALHEFFAEEGRPGFRDHWLLKLQDPFVRNPSGRFQPNALWVALGLLAAVVVATFLYFNFMRL